MYSIVMLYFTAIFMVFVLNDLIKLKVCDDFEWFNGCCAV